MLGVKYNYIFLVYKVDESVMVPPSKNKINTFFFIRNELQNKYPRVAKIPLFRHEALL